MSSPLPRFRHEIAATIKLAAPLALAQLAQVAMGATDTVLLGTLGRDALAAGGLGANLFFTLMIVVAGGLVAVSILVSHARGAEQHDRIGPILRGGFLLALLASLPPMLLLWSEHPLLLMIGEPPALADAIARYDRVLLFAMPASLAMATQRGFLAAMGRPYMVMVVALVAVVVNGLLNYGLIHGAWGLPRMGYIGSCTATLITLWAMMLAIALEMRFTPMLRPFRLIGRIEWHILVELAVLGWPIAFITAMEIVLFSAAAMLIGRFGATQLAAHQISIGIASLTFMVPYAIAQAVNVRVGYYIGRGSPRAGRRAGFAAFVLGIGFMAAMAVMLLSIPDVIAGFYISGADPARGDVIALAVRLLTVAAFFQVFDGAQTIAAGALRGLKDTRLPAAAASIGYWGIGFPTAWLFGVRLGYGALGIWWGLAASLAAVAILLSVRFIWLSASLTTEIKQEKIAAVI
ncbi:MAG TPA: MATE family efflux transporter [Alphaproteobacteria bacterium]|jgi:MATE family multidrug resistance protein|nr:MATE family efflux transporter [Alphaproteobacteria bacterium]